MKPFILFWQDQGTIHTRAICDSGRRMPQTREHPGLQGPNRIFTRFAFVAFWPARLVAARHRAQGTGHARARHLHQGALVREASTSRCTSWAMRGA